MIKKYLFAAVLLVSGFGLMAQHHHKCGTDIVLQEQLKDPEVRAKYEAFQESVKRYTSDPRVAVQRENGIRIIPVVFHVLHEGGAENVSMSRIETLLQSMNNDFRRLNADTSNTPDRFYGDTEISHLVIESDSVAAMVGDSSVVVLHNRYGESFAFHFNNGTGVIADSLMDDFDNIFEVSVSSNADTADLATALANAVNSANGLTAVYVNDGEHRVEIETDGLGYVNPVSVQQLVDHVSSTIIQNGTYLPADSKIEFRLATKDPLGNCTDGVVRVFTSKTNDANNSTGFKAVSYWNAYSYLNVWVVKNISFDTGQGTTLGYAQFPATGLLSTDGITVISGTVNAGANGGRTATHEVGHWLSLIHVWGDAFCGSDNVLDTPTAYDKNFGVCGNVGMPNHTQPYFGAQVCDPDNPDGEMFNNYMDYSPDFCQNMFTLGQKARMDFTLEGDGTTPGVRSYLISDENLEGTGTADPYMQSDCAPISAFYFQQGSDFARQKMICVGENVRFEEDAYNGDVDDFFWTFEGGDPATDTDDNPLVSYDTPGVYDVTLDVSNAMGSDSHTEEDMVIVSSTTAQNQSNWGYVDSFWDEQDFLDDYVVFNQDQTDNKWEWYYGPDGGSTGWESVRLFNLFNTQGEIEELISPSYNLSTVANPTLQFRYSGAARTNAPMDQLRIMASDDCGESWSTRETLEGFELTNAGLVPDSYVPNEHSTWTDISVGLGSFANKNNVRVKFRWVVGEGAGANNFYIDDITLASALLGMEDLERQIDLNLAPNPTSDVTSVSMSLLETSRVKMELVDVLGRDTKLLMSKDLTRGKHRVDVDLAKYPVGVYYLRISVDNDMVVKKIVKN